MIIISGLFLDNNFMIKKLIIYSLLFLGLVEPGYNIAFNEQENVCDFAEYNLNHENLKTPDRQAKFAEFHSYGNVLSADYSNSGYSRGHLIPYFAMGGDRNYDGNLSDDFELARYREINSMKNISPQDQNLNGPGGSWFSIETFIRKKLITPDRDAHIIVGTIFGKIDFDKLRGKIGVPPLFYQIIIFDDQSISFLVPHQRFGHHENIREYIVSIRLIESLTGKDFKTNVNETEESLELFDKINKGIEE